MLGDEAKFKHGFSSDKYICHYVIPNCKTFVTISYIQ